MEGEIDSVVTSRDLGSVSPESSVIKKLNGDTVVCESTSQTAVSWVGSSHDYSFKQGAEPVILKETDEVNSSELYNTEVPVTCVPAMVDDGLTFFSETTTGKGSPTAPEDTPKGTPGSQKLFIPSPSGSLSQQYGPGSADLNTKRKRGAAETPEVVPVEVQRETCMPVCSGHQSITFNVDAAVKLKYRALDVEFIHDPDTRKQHLARVALLDGEGKIIHDLFSAPHGTISPELWHNAHVGPIEKQRKIEEIINIIKKDVRGKTLIVHSGWGDLKVLEIVRDSSTYIVEISNLRALKKRVGCLPGNQVSLKKAMLSYGIHIQTSKHHCPVEDSAATLYLYYQYRGIGLASLNNLDDDVN